MFTKNNISVLTLGLLLGMSLINTPSQARQAGMCWCDNERRKDLETRDQCEQTACTTCRGNVCRWEQEQWF
ncbi:MAG: hypothetical protein H0X26_05015 [Alphaproteobacteria bacterium]|nr:hypothetical protein [Alphaproteobacteria bacterium]